MVLVISLDDLTIFKTNQKESDSSVIISLMDFIMESPLTVLTSR